MLLAEMDAMVPWCRLLVRIEPHYPKAWPKGWHPPMPPETMLRVYFLQNRYALRDQMAEETLYDSKAMRRFPETKLGDDRIPDATTILNFRHLLARHGLSEAILMDVIAHLADKGITAAIGGFGGCDDHRRAVIDQEQGGRRARSKAGVGQEQGGRRLGARRASARSKAGVG